MVDVVVVVVSIVAGAVTKSVVTAGEPVPDTNSVSGNRNVRVVIDVEVDFLNPELPVSGAKSTATGNQGVAVKLMFVLQVWIAVVHFLLILLNELQP